MARLTLLALVAAAAMAAMSGHGVAEDSAIGNIVPDHALDAVDLDGNPVTFFNGTGDLDDDDYPEDSTAALTRRGRRHAQRVKSARKASRLDGITIGPIGDKKIWSKTAVITWYASQDLKNPKCGDGKWNPTNSYHIGAVMAGWKGGPKCGDFVQLCNKKKNNKCLSIRVVDQCAGCDQNHVDLTKSAFKKLSNTGTLTEGKVHDLVMYHGATPNPWDLQLFGPFKLGGGQIGN